MNGPFRIGVAQFDFGGSMPVAALPSRIARSVSPGPIAALYWLTVAASAAGSSPSFSASSSIVSASTGGWSVRMMSATFGQSRIAFSATK